MQSEKKPHRRVCRRELHPPQPPLRVALLEPEIPPNTGNIARLCAATGAPLHLIGMLGFRLTDSALRRAGLDYWDEVEIHRHAALPEFFDIIAPERCHFLSVAGGRDHTQAAYAPGDALVFGSESRGLPDALLKKHSDRVLAIPMRPGKVRSLNLATAVGVVLYEALRQTGAWS